MAGRVYLAITVWKLRRAFPFRSAGRRPGRASRPFHPHYAFLDSPLMTFNSLDFCEFIGISANFSELNQIEQPRRKDTKLFRKFFNR